MMKIRLTERSSFVQRMFREEMSSLTSGEWISPLISLDP
uniref:Uncharacterized protein n=1 Tax=Picea sitchensis TaxID=3332 RepID=A9NK31_PICSI|nr:unknown [Picea sitchensis]